MRIADLTSQGLRNICIAESLHIQPATVQVHVRSTYRKTTVTGRINLRHRQ